MAEVDEKTYWRVSEIVREGDVTKIDAAFNRFPEMITACDPISGGNWLLDAISQENLELVRYLVDRGVPLNVTNDSGNCPLSEIAYCSDYETVKWMIEKGADPRINNWPMISAVSAGSLEIVKLFVEHGAEINFVFGVPPRTPLSQAIDFGHKEVAEYLQSLGAMGVPEAKTEPIDAVLAEEEWDDDIVEAELAESLSDEERHEEIIAYFTHHTHRKPERLGMQELIPGKVRVSVWTIACNGFHIIFTSGMSTRPMHVPQGQEEYQYAELMMYLPADWPIQPKVDSPQLWPWRWLRTIAHYPHEQNTWLGGPLTTFANGEPPEPLEAGCDFTAFLLAYELNFPSFESLDGRLIKIITAMPIYTEELRLAQQEDGFTKLLLRLQEEGITPTLKPNRPNVAL